MLAPDVESGREYEIRARVVLNCTGAFSDEVRRMDDPQAEALIAPSTGVHTAGQVLPARRDPIMVPAPPMAVLFATPGTTAWWWARPTRSTRPSWNPSRLRKRWTSSSKTPTTT